MFTVGIDLSAREIVQLMLSRHIGRIHKLFTIVSQWHSHIFFKFQFIYFNANSCIRHSTDFNVNSFNDQGSNYSSVNDELSNSKEIISEELNDSVDSLLNNTDYHDLSHSSYETVKYSEIKILSLNTGG